MSEPILQPYKASLVAHITDTTDKSAETKIFSSYVKHLGAIGLRDHTVKFVPAVTTLEIGILASELISNRQRPPRVVLSLNCAGPDKEDGTPDNARNDFFCAQLEDQVFVSGTSNGYELSYIKSKIKALYRLITTNHGHPTIDEQENGRDIGERQFRSFSILPEHSLLFSVKRLREQLIADGILQRVENVDDIVRSPPSDSHVFEVDNFRNVKLFLSPKHLEFLQQQEGRKIKFAFGATSLETDPHSVVALEGSIALVTSTLFEPPLGTNVVARHSSSWRADGNTVPMLANIRKNPGTTLPDYGIPTPLLGARVNLRPYFAQAGLGG